MDPISILLGLVVGAAVAGVAAALVFRPALKESEVKRQLAEERVQQLLEQARQAREEIAAKEAALREAAGLRPQAERAAELERRLSEALQARATLEAERRAMDEKVELLRSAREEMSQAFKAITAEIAAQTRDELLKQAGADFAQRQKAVESLIAPLGEALQKYEAHLRELEGKNARVDQQNQQVIQLIAETRAETAKLVRALRQPQVRGRWGEVQLRRVAEAAGMVENCDFQEQVSVEGASGRQRPDMIVRMPGGRIAVVDAKVPLDAYLEAVEAEDEAVRARRMADHARQLREHVKKLGSKNYWEAMPEAPSFTVMFVPDPFLSAALEREPAIMEEAWRAGVVIATPMTLLTILRVVADDWRRAQFEENSRRVIEAGRELYKRIGTFLEHFDKVGAGLKSAIERYNRAVGSLDRMVLPKAREFGRFGVLSVQDAELAAPAEILEAPRQLAAPEAGALADERRSSAA